MYGRRVKRYSKKRYAFKKKMQKGSRAKRYVRKRKSFTGPKLSIKRFSATAPLGDVAYATLKMVTSNVLTSTVSGTGVAAYTVNFNALDALRNQFGLAPGLVNYSQTFFDYRITGVRFVIDYMPEVGSDNQQMLFTYAGQDALPTMVYNELPERRFVKTKMINAPAAGKMTRIIHDVTVRMIDPRVRLDTLSYSGVTTLSNPWATSPAEIVRFACGVMSIRPFGYATASTQGLIRTTAYVKIVYWNRRQQTHV